MSESKQPVLAGSLGNLDGKQESSLEIMKAQFQDVLVEEGREEDKDRAFVVDSHTLLRFLRARKFDVQQASKMLRATLQWRKENR
jgi:hypothetical protein